MNTKLNKPTIAVEGAAIGFFPPAFAQLRPSRFRQRRQKGRPFLCGFRRIVTIV